MTCLTDRGRIATGMLFALVLVPGPARGGAQSVVTLDEGEFRLLEKGREVGTETFTIRQSGSGDEAVIIANARVLPADGSGVDAVVQVAGGTLRPAAYDIVADSRQDPTIHGIVRGRRVTATIRSSAGENVREYLVSEGAVLAEPAVAHHHWFVAQRAIAGTTRLPLIVPSESRQVFAELSVEPAEPIMVSGRRIDARRVTVRPDGSPERRIWIDDTGRILRLEIPDLGLVAERTTAPG
ncbi:MAG: hypothetical protein L0271_08050 [Gemmatimonadetes bacterium]|nr:hypothetical protein [Gemmatimonadota bacterium]